MSDEELTGEDRDRIEVTFQQLPGRSKKNHEENLFRIITPAEIRAGNIPDTSRESHWYTNLFCGFSFMSYEPEDGNRSNFLNAKVIDPNYG
jgi:hypothetical protein